VLPGTQLTFTAAAEDANGNAIASPSVTWSSGDVAVATTTGTGTVTAVAAGATTIVATSGTVADTANLTVVVVTVDSVDVSPDSLSVAVSGTDNVSARFFDALGTEILGPIAAWQSTDAAVATVTSTGVVSGVAPGTAWIVGTEDNGADSTHVTVIAVSQFDIEVRYVGTLPSASVQTAFSDAEARWEELLIGDLPSVAVTLAAAECVTVAHPAVAETIDDLVIFAEVTAIDGPGGTLAQAGPCVVRSIGGLALVGVMQFDEEDLTDLEATSDLVETIIHEMGHVLGLGAGTPWSTTLVDAGGADPFWPGTEAVTQYGLNGGAATNSVPVANTGGAGTADAHWREAHMGRELMTGFINIGAVNPLSKITIGAMKDMGYTSISRRRMPTPSAPRYAFPQTASSDCRSYPRRRRSRSTRGERLAAPGLHRTSSGAWNRARAGQPNRTTMAYIPYVPYEDADGLLAELYEQYGDGPSGVDNIIRIHSLNPRSMRDHMGLYAHLMRGRSPLTRIQREMLAVTVSALNDCFY
jgi:hypothetical protein